MQLTPEQEAEILKGYENLMRATASRFYSRYDGVRRIDYQDCLQECRLAVLKRIRAAETMEQIRVFPVRDCIHAMCTVVLGSLPLSVPMRTADYRKRLGEQVEIWADEQAELDDLVSEEERGFDSVNEHAAFGSFLDHISPQDRHLLLLMAAHGSQKEVARHLGVNPSTVCRNLARLRNRWRNECDIGGK